MNTELNLKEGDITLEPIVKAHAVKLYNKLQNERLYTFIPHNPPKTIENLENKYLRWSQRKSEDGKEIWLNYAIYLNTVQDYVGTVQATIIIDEDISYIAYEVFPDFWRMHIALKSCRILVDYLFNVYKIKTIAALVDTRNTASWKLLESLNFSRESIIYDADEFKGHKSDEYLYKLSNIHWKESLM